MWSRWKREDSLLFLLLILKKNKNISNFIWRITVVNCVCKFREKIAIKKDFEILNEQKVYI